MTLPKVSVPTYETELPSTKKKITFRPFLVREEKILLLPLSADVPDPTEIARATKQVIGNCILTPGVDIEALTFFDIEHIMLQLRIKSQGETLQIKFSPVKDSACPDCMKPRTVDVNLSEVKVSSSPDHKCKLELQSSPAILGIVMKYPTLETIGTYEKSNASQDLSEIFNVIWECVDYVYDADKTYKASEYSNQEGAEFIESLNDDQFKQIREFFETMPMLRHTVHLKCAKCDFHTDYELKGYQSFFV